MAKDGFQIEVFCNVNVSSGNLSSTLFNSLESFLLRRADGFSILDACKTIEGPRILPDHVNKDRTTGDRKENRRTGRSSSTGDQQRKYQAP